MSPTLSKITRRNGIAGQVAYTVTATYGDETDPPSPVTFIGDTSGVGPVIMQTPTFEVFVTDPSRCGKFGPQWVRNFFGVTA